MLGNDSLVQTRFQPVDNLLFALLRHRLTDRLASLGSKADLGASIEDLHVHLSVLVLDSQTSNLVPEHAHSVSIFKEEAVHFQLLTFKHVADKLYGSALSWFN